MRAELRGRKMFPRRGGGERGIIFSARCARTRRIAVATVSAFHRSSLRSHERRESVVPRSLRPVAARASITSVPRRRARISPPFRLPRIRPRAFFKRACCREAEGHACGAGRPMFTSRSGRFRTRRACASSRLRAGCGADAKPLQRAQIRARMPSPAHDETSTCSARARKGACSPSSRGRRRAEVRGAADEVDPAVAQSFIGLRDREKKLDRPLQPSLPNSELDGGDRRKVRRRDHVGYAMRSHGFRLTSSAACSGCAWAWPLPREALHLVGFRIPGSCRQKNSLNRFEARYGCRCGRGTSFWLMTSTQPCEFEQASSSARSVSTSRSLDGSSSSSTCLGEHRLREVHPAALAADNVPSFFCCRAP